MMNNAARLSFALLVGLSFAGAPSLVSAQDGRDAAIARCVKFAHTQHPDDSEGNTQARTAAYKSCMTAAGHAP